MDPKSNPLSEGTIAHASDPIRGWLQTELPLALAQVFFTIGFEHSHKGLFFAGMTSLLLGSVGALRGKSAFHGIDRRHLKPLLPMMIPGIAGLALEPPARAYAAALFLFCLALSVGVLAFQSKGRPRC